MSERWRKLQVEGHRVLELSRSPELALFAMRTTLVPVGIAFRSPQPGWAVLDFVPCEHEAMS